MSKKKEKKSGFPSYPSLDAARCFVCGGPTVDPRDEDMADGDGRYSALCKECGMRTWFDLIKAEDK